MPLYKSAFLGMEEVKTASLLGTSSTGKCTHTNNNNNNNNCSRMKKHRFMNYCRNINFGLGQKFRSTKQQQVIVEIICENADFTTNLVNFKTEVNKGSHGFHKMVTIKIMIKKNPPTCVFHICWCLTAF